MYDHNTFFAFFDLEVDIHMHLIRQYPGHWFFTWAVNAIDGDLS